MRLPPARLSLTRISLVRPAAGRPRHRPTLLPDRGLPHGPDLRHTTHVRLRRGLDNPRRGRNLVPPIGPTLGRTLRAVADPPRHRPALRHGTRLAQRHRLGNSRRWRKFGPPVTPTLGRTLRAVTGRARHRPALLPDRGLPQVPAVLEDRHVTDGGDHPNLRHTTHNRRRRGLDNPGRGQNFVPPIRPPLGRTLRTVASRLRRNRL